MKDKIFRFQSSSRYAQIPYLGLLAICCFPFISASAALVLGLAFSLIIGTPFKDTINKWNGHLLRASVIGFGFGININALIDAGKGNIGITTSFVVGVLVVGLAIGLILKIDRVTSLLIAVGTAICGGSAIVAVGSTIKANPDQLSIATGTVFLLNALGLLLFPTMGHWLGLSQEQFGHWAAIAIHDTSSVVGAGAKYGDEALKIATVAKMLRILWIIPVLIILVIGSAKNNRTMKFPIFILGFIVTSCLYSFLPAWDSLFKSLYTGAKQMMVVSLFLIGSSVSFDTLKQIGGRVMLQAVTLWVIVTVIALLVIMCM